MEFDICTCQRSNKRHPSFSVSHLLLQFCLLIFPSGLRACHRRLSVWTPLWRRLLQRWRCVSADFLKGPIFRSFPPWMFCHPQITTECRKNVVWSSENGTSIQAKDKWKKIIIENSGFCLIWDLLKCIATLWVEPSPTAIHVKLCCLCSSPVCVFLPSLQTTSLSSSSCWVKFLASWSWQENTPRSFSPRKVNSHRTPPQFPPAHPATSCLLTAPLKTWLFILWKSLI